MEIARFYSDIYLKHPIVCTDTRCIREGSMFFALKGDNFNGNTFAMQAINQGASYVVVDEVVNHSNAIFVDNVLLFLQKLANYHRKQLSIPVIGITGTNGKTTTKELVYAVLSEKYRVSCTQGNLNNHIGVPLTILSIPVTTEIAIVEMGANHRGEIAELCAIAEPNFGVITNVGKAHLEGFGSFENIIATKTELYRSIEANDGTVFLDIDNQILSQYTTSISGGVVSYSDTDNSASVFGEIIKNAVCASFELTIGDITVEVESKLFGGYNTKNMLAASCIANYFNVPILNIKNALENYTPSNNRSQITHTRTNTLILDAYNANPTSMNVAISHFNIISSHKKKLIILGEMFELGKDKAEEHKAIQKLATKSNISTVFFVGNWKKMDNPKVSCFASSQELVHYLETNKIEESLILIKGSRGVKLETIIPYL